MKVVIYMVLLCDLYEYLHQFSSLGKFTINLSYQSQLRDSNNRAAATTAAQHVITSLEAVSSSSARDDVS